MDFKSALTKVCHDFSKDIIFQRRIISILDDYMAFKDVPYYKLYYRTVLSSGDLIKLISLNDNIRNQEVYIFVSLTGLDEKKVKSFLSDIYECYHGILLEPISYCKCDKSSNTDDSQQSIVVPPTINGNHILFMGKELGGPVEEMIEFLISKGFSRLYELGHPKLKGDFAGLKDATIIIWPTDSGKVWSIVVIVQSDFSFLKELFKAKYTNVRIELNTRTYSERLIFSTNGGEIKLSKEIRNNRINYIDAVTYELHNIEQKHKNELRRKQEEAELNHQIRNVITDI